ncbi:MAG: Glucose-1-phosphate adenylyltransferase, partial [uncultured Gemmatimonadetes bacterium]
ARCHSRRRRRVQVVPADQGSREARRASRGQVPPDRRSHLQLHQLRALPDVRAHAVQLRVAQQPHLALVRLRPLPRRLRDHPGRGADGLVRALVPGDGRRRAPVHAAHPQRTARPGHHPLRRPALRHGLPEDAGAPRGDGGRHHRGRHPRDGRGRARLRHHAYGREAPHHRLLREAAARRAGGQGEPRHPRDAGRGAHLPGVHGHLHLQRLHADGRAGHPPRRPRLRQADHPRRHRQAERGGVPVPGVLERHRHGAVVLRNQHHAGPAAPGVQPVRPGDAAVHQRAHAPAGQDDAHAGGARRGGGGQHHRRQRDHGLGDRCALVHLRRHAYPPRRAAGVGLLRLAGGGGAQLRPGPRAPGDRRGHPHRERHRGPQRVHRQALPHRERRGRARRRGPRLVHPRRHRRRHQERRDRRRHGDL